MQKEIEQLVVAFYNDQKQEKELLQGILAAIAVASAARRNMIQHIAAAVAKTPDVEAVKIAPKSASFESDVENAVSALRQRAN